MAQVAKIRNYIVLSDKKGMYTVKKKYYSAVDYGWHTKTLFKCETLRDAVLCIADLDDFDKR